MPTSVVDQIRSHGIVGAGGAGFPTHVKLATPASVYIVNAAECEPLLDKDKELLKHYADEVIQGLVTAMESVGAGQGVFGIKYKYHDVIELLSRKVPASIRVHELGDYYPAGDEFILVWEVTDRVIPPGGLPKDVDSVVSNVETLLNIARNRPVTTKFLSVVGDVESPVTVEVPIGTPMKDILPLAGGSRSASFAVLEGGIMMGKLVEDLEKPVTKTTGAMIVLPDGHPVLRRYRREWKQIQGIGRAACDQCSFCTELCPRYLLGHPIEPHKAMRALGFVQDSSPHIVGTTYCCECNVCTMIACPEDLDPKNVCREYKGVVKQQGLRWEGKARPPHPVAKGRRTPVKRLMVKLNLTQYSRPAPLIGETVSPALVRIPLKQHVGAPAVASVQVGARVNPGDVIAAPRDGALGSVIHASIAGEVTAVNGDIVIEAV